MIDPRMLVDQAQAAPLPAPVWFIELFKVLGFTLHAVPMNLWYAGLLIALWLRLRGGKGDSHHLPEQRDGCCAQTRIASFFARQFGDRLLRQMPVIIAVGVNLGIVPLLFIQLAYSKFFYPATILMAWFWFGIIMLLIPAYYGVYTYVWGLRNGGRMAKWRVAVGWCAAIFFIAIGFTFANGLSLVEHVSRWPSLWLGHNVAGATLGTALNVGDPTLWPRWLLMFGFALGTTAVWAVFDAQWFARDAVGDDYRRWAWSFARKLYTVSMLWTAAAGSWYVFGTWADDLRRTMLDWPLLPLTVATAIAPGACWVLVLIGGSLQARRLGTAVLAIGQLGVLGINAVSRQVVQNLDQRPYLDVTTQAVDVQWGPLLMFLLTFVIGLAVVVWMIAQVRKYNT
ncbi:MAG: hypothetical protein LLG00_06760 [Planctomycetaceae bacterium]|nr:hypothetical protein [Planctomycetaceae bacterium]